MHLVESELGSNLLGNIASVAGKHDARFHASGMEVADGLLGVVLYRVGDHDVAT